MRYMLILSGIMIWYHGICQPEVGYFLPKKIIYISVPFTISQDKLFKLDQATGQPEGGPIKFVTTVKVEGDIKIETKMYPFMYKTLNLDPLGKAGRSFNFDVKYDQNGNGVISTINASQTPVTSEIITGTVNIISSALKLVSGMHGYSGGNELPTTIEQTTEQKIVETRAVEIISDQTVGLTIKPEILAATTVVQPLPSVVVTITKESDPAIEYDKEMVKSDNTDEAIKRNGVSGIWVFYRVPAVHLIQVKVLNNQLIKEQEIINQTLLIPQTGTEVMLSIPILKKKKTFSVGFDPETGNLSTYGLKKEAQVNENLTSINSGIGSLSTELINLKTAIADEKAKKEQDAVNKNLKNEIDSLQLEKDKLDLLIEKQTLLNQLDDLKKQENPKTKK